MAVTSLDRAVLSRQQDNWTTTGIWTVGAAAAAMSWTGWFLLAILCGWPKWLAALLPFSVDVYVVTSARVWLKLTWVTRETRRFAAVSTMLAVLFSIAANAAYHLMQSLGVHRAPWGVVVAVSGLAPLMLALVAHLQARLNSDRMAAEKATAVQIPELATPAPEVQGVAPNSVQAAEQDPVQDDSSGPTARAGSARSRRRRSGHRRRSGSPADQVNAEAAILAILTNEGDISGAEIARRVGVSESYVSRIKKGLSLSVAGPDQKTASQEKGD